MEFRRDTLHQFYRGKRILVTGHTGVKGCWLANVLLRMGARVTGVALAPNTSPSMFEALSMENRLESRLLDIRRLDDLRHIVLSSSFDIVFHLAAQPLVRESYIHPVYTFETNTLGSIHVLEALREAPSAKAALMITTDKVYENREGERPYRESDRLGGHDPYSASKACAEIAVDAYVKSFFPPDAHGDTHQLLVAVARAGNVLCGGDWSTDRLVPDVVRSVYDSKTPLVLRNPGAVRPWQFVLEPLAGYLELAKGLYEGNRGYTGAWNFAPPDENCVSVEDVVQRCLKVLGKGSYTVAVDQDAPYEAKLLRLDASKAKQRIGWNSFLTMDEVLEWTFDWYRAYYEGEDILLKTEQQIESYWRHERDA